LARAAADGFAAALRDPRRGAVSGGEPDLSAAELARERSDRAWLARETVARIALERLAEPARVEEALRDAEIEYATEPDRLIRAWSWLLQARLDAGDLPGARSLFRELERRFAEADPARIARAGRALGAALLAAAQAGKSAEPDVERVRAAECFFLWADLSVRAGLPAGVDAVTAAARLNLQVAAGGHDLSAARRAETLFRYLTEGPLPAPAAPDRWTLLAERAQALGLRRRWDDAVRLLEPELAAHPEAAALYDPLARACLALADVGRPGAADRALALAEELFARAEPDSAAWWSAKLLAADALLRRREYPALRALLRDLRLTRPDLDGGRFGAREACARLEAALPPE
ncbi:MAG: hypothetical protein HZA54_20220, partial [Planctomycetes bacterium]|nr:hypothetical protein [Planctomycetota bacterium]